MQSDWTSGTLNAMKLGSGMGQDADGKRRRQDGPPMDAAARTDRRES